VFCKPVRIDESKKVVIGRFANCGQQRVFVGHRFYPPNSSSKAGGCPWLLASSLAVETGAAKVLFRLSLPGWLSRRRREARRPAGLWDLWTKGEKPVESRTILTTEANVVLQPVHERTPFNLLRTRPARSWSA
jgi:hypothetical protein